MKLPRTCAPRGPAPCLLALLVLLASVAPCRADVFINGERVRGITSLTLEGCTVTFNATGDIHILAPGWRVAPAAAQGDQLEAVPQPAGPVAACRNRYFLVARTETPGAVPLDFEVLVGGRKVKTLSSEDNGLVVELTLFLVPGTNTVEIRSLAKTAVAGAPGDRFTLLVGRGRAEAGTLEIDDVLLTYEVTAGDPAPRTDRFEIQAK
ncbi:MAG: hypothetical protein FJ098_11575 [Deltaproteobacteria bacterium]|nr:hypothetical protein [Deltaproteobacteria bacterium]